MKRENLLRQNYKLKKEKREITNLVPKMKIVEKNLQLSFDEIKKILRAKYQEVDNEELIELISKVHQKQKNRINKKTDDFER